MQPYEALSGLNGKNSYGTWKLRITDQDANGDVGQIVGVELRFSDNEDFSSCDANFTYSG